MSQVTFLFTNQPLGLSNVVRGARGELIAWIENGWNVSITRTNSVIAINVPQISAQMLIYFGSNGIVTSVAGDFIPSVLLDEIMSSGLDGSSNTTMVLAQSAIPVIIPSNGTIATNGTVTLVTALPTTYAAAFCYFPAGAVSGDATGGLYYVAFSSTTVGVVYAGKVGAALGVGSTPFAPSVPAALTAVTGSNGAYTQTTGSDIVLVNATVPGASMGINGALRVIEGVAVPNNVNAKTLKNQLGGTAFGGAIALASAAGGEVQRMIRNRGALGSQVAMAATTVNSLGAQLAAYHAIDTSVDKALAISGQLATATDYLVLETYTFEMLSA